MFIVLAAKSDAASADTIRGWCADIATTARSLIHRYPGAQLRCVVGFGSDAWDRLFGAPRPAELRPFKAICGARHSAPSTPGDILLHLRAETVDLVFELAARLIQGLGDAVSPIDEVHGFRAFDARSMIGFVDGTENPEGAAADAAALVGDEDPEFAGGSYVLVQKYLHQMAAWHALSVDEQQRVIGRTKQDDIELDPAHKPSNAHSALTVITDAEGNELKIVRANLGFGRPSEGEFGTYFIGYCKTPTITERMLTNMVIGDPPGNHDRLLDFSKAVTGTLFFVPSADLLESLAERSPGPMPDAAEPPATAAAAAPPAGPAGSKAEPNHRDDGSLIIGSLKPV
jgi:putative iron-dependent peroxidase